MRLKSESCEFGSLQDSLMRGRVVYYGGHQILQNKGKVTHGVKANEAAQAQMKVLTDAENTASVNVIRKLKKKNLNRNNINVGYSRQVPSETCCLDVLCG